MKYLQIVYGGGQCGLVRQKTNTGHAACPHERMPGNVLNKKVGKFTIKKNTERQRRNVFCVNELQVHK